MFESRERAKQLIDFSGMSYSGANARPMDIDLAMDCRRGEVFIFGEIKYAGKPVPSGQRWWLYNIINALKAGGKRGLAMILDHNITDAAIDVQAASCRVREYITTETVGFGWSTPRRDYTCDEMIKAYLSMSAAP